MPSAIEFEHISKQYRLGVVSSRTLGADLGRWWQMSVLGKEDPYLKVGETNDRAAAATSDFVWALRDIDFKVEQGEVLGIIGKNGAGKSTLLKLLSKVTGPTTGQIRARGRIASLLEVGTGFHPELTGRENIYMNGAILGMTRKEITDKLDEIVAFSGCERYVDTPVKRYSSGMTVRLGFAIAAHLDPEILVVDEVLAVGDAEFQRKAIGKMKDVSQGEGRTVLFVSHNMASLRRLCNRGVLLENGLLKMDGPISEVCDTYLKDNMGETGTGLWEKEKLEDKVFQMTRAEFVKDDGKAETSFSCDENLNLVMDFLVKERVPGVYGYLGIYREDDGSLVWVSDSNDVTFNKLETLPEGKSKVRVTIPKRMLAPGRYYINLNYTSKFYAGGWNVDSPGNMCHFEIHDYKSNRGDSRQGAFSALLDWTIL